MQGELLAWFDWLAALAAEYPIAGWIGRGRDSAAGRARDLARRRAPEAAGRGARAAPPPPADGAGSGDGRGPGSGRAAVAPAPARLRDRLRRTSDALVGRLAQLLGGAALDAALLDELEALLFGADLGVKTAESLLATRAHSRPRAATPTRCARVLRAAILGEAARASRPPRRSRARAASRT